ncbi:polysaccharide biosynthesis protein [Altericista sp. CCNU0014]|uniref:polysaccharide biosynthesis protein n=1 Tax=Altericista sp. CCNU0014 TaxID=3082949 RepID=UPI00384C8DDC
MGSYRRCWRFASTEDLLQIAAACAAISFAESFILSIAYFYGASDIFLLPRSFPLLDGLLTFTGVGAARFSVKAFEKSLHQRRSGQPRERVIIYGAGTAGVALVDAIQRRERSALEPVAFIDDDPKKLDLKIRGISVLGSRLELPDLVARLDVKRVIIAIPSAGGTAIREIVQLCRDLNLATSTLPSIHEIIDGKVNLKSVRDVKIEDLLRRDTICSDLEKVAPNLRSKRVLVTGAGGSIGSEICRQILQCHPAELILMGHGENSVFSIQQELNQLLQALRASQPHLSIRLSVLIADLKDHNRLEYAFQKFKPEVVFHAAAHKHVPMMELNPSEAIMNNVLGTKNLVEMALAHNTSQFVMISTDKAVNPSSLMGASKRVGELIVLRAAQQKHKQFCVVRFGNVLGSRGSVVPTLKGQIERGGPVTITHPDVTRYFMTIPEAVHLVLQAKAISQGGEIFMLNMGRPIKIVDLARDLIRLSGYEVGTDIDIIYTGLRPGEKLHEELFLAEEACKPTENENLFVVQNAVSQIPTHLEEGLHGLFQAALDHNEVMIRFYFKRLIPGLRSNSGSSIFPTQRSLRLAQFNPFKGDRKPQPHISSRPNPLSPAPNPSRGDELAQELSVAVVTRDFKVLYQPILMLQKNYVVAGFEALLHWEHPRHGLMRSSQFIQIADRTQHIHAIGLWGMREICLQLRTLEVLNLHPSFTISVNWSSSQLLHPDFIANLGAIFQETQANVSRLCFEIPEQFITQHPEAAIAALLKMKGLGARLLLDNFGFSPLKQLSPLMDWVHIFDGLKIDRSRIHELSQNADNLDFFQTVLDLSKSWGLDTIATGIESPQQLTQLKNLQCKYGQGYFFLRPINGAQAQTLLQVQSLN